MSKQRTTLCYTTQHGWAICSTSNQVFASSSGVSISTPFRGSSTADWAKYVVPSYPLFRDIGRKSDPIKKANEIELDIPWTQIVSTTGGVPYHNGPNDGVVTLASMTHRTDMEYIEVPHTHYETMCSDQVAEIVAERYSRTLTAEH